MCPPPPQRLCWNACLQHLSQSPYVSLVAIILSSWYSTSHVFPLVSPHGWSHLCFGRILVSRGLDEAWAIRKEGIQLERDGLEDTLLVPLLAMLWPAHGLIPSYDMDYVMNFVPS